mgnify:CR=1 FL=1
MAKSKSKRTKIEDEKEALEDRLGAVLGRLGCRLGVMLGDCSLKNTRFREHSRSLKSKVSRGDLGRS